MTASGLARAKSSLGGRVDGAVIAQLHDLDVRVGVAVVGRQPVADVGLRQLQSIAAKVVIQRVVVVAVIR